ncbi:hypothetical protein GCM10029964_053810 [Kibdelosporangium lantanae]
MCIGCRVVNGHAVSNRSNTSGISDAPPLRANTDISTPFLAHPLHPNNITGATTRTGPYCPVVSGANGPFGDARAVRPYQRAGGALITLGFSWRS